jgi:D-glycero-alpha-D-manno-heptose 1-phosphate guanylyltransferase
VNTAPLDPGDVDAIVLAGGFGTRLRSVVTDLPKPMAPVAGRPFLEHVLWGLSRQGVRRAVLSVGYLHEKIVGHFGPRFENLALTYVVEDTPLGTGGAIAAALPHCHSEAVLVLNGDTWLDLPLAPLLALWRAHREPVIVAREVPDVSRYGALDVDGQASGRRVLRFAEKGRSGPGLINAGVYLLPNDVFGGRPPASPFAFEAGFLAPLVASASVRAFVCSGEFIDIGVPEDYERAQSMALGRTLSP